MVDLKGRLIVADEQATAHNARIQIFDQNGKFGEQWTDIGLEQQTGLAITADDTVYLGDNDAITILKNGKVIDVIGILQARPHNIAIDPGTGVLQSCRSSRASDGGRHFLTGQFGTLWPLQALKGTLDQEALIERPREFREDW